MYYIYKIENIVNHKKYIGLTNNIARRRARHFTDLRGNRHDNSFLQKEFNIYGQENFTFSIEFEGDITAEEIGEKEKEYIQKYDSYYNGYNQNQGGNFGPSNGGSHLIKSDIFNICAALEFCSRPGAILAGMYEVTTTTISRIKHKTNHCEIIQEYDNLPLEERKNIYKIFCESTNFYTKKINQTVLSTKRKLSREQVYRILLNEEYHFMTKEALAKELGVSSRTFYFILKGECYKNYKYDYDNLTQDQKNEFVSLFSNE